MSFVHLGDGGRRRPDAAVVLDCRLLASLPNRAAPSGRPVKAALAPRTV